LGEGLTTPHHVNVPLLSNILRQSLGPALILWYDLRNYWGDLDVDERIISRWIFRKWDVGALIGSS
jgi:hypothetical protein